MHGCRDALHHAGQKTEFDGQRLVTGINCQPESVYADFMTTKRLYHKTDGVLFYHMVQSFPKGEVVDPVTAHAAALKLAEYPAFSAAAHFLIKYTHLPAAPVYLLVTAAAFAGGLLLYEIISRIPVVRWCVLGIRRPQEEKKEREGHV